MSDRPQADEIRRADLVAALVAALAADRRRRDRLPRKRRGPSAP